MKLQKYRREEEAKGVAAEIKKHKDAGLPLPAAPKPQVVANELGTVGGLFEQDNLATRGLSLHVCDVFWTELDGALGEDEWKGKVRAR